MVARQRAARYGAKSDARRSAPVRARDSAKRVKQEREGGGREKKVQCASAVAGAQCRR